MSPAAVFEEAKKLGLLTAVVEVVKAILRGEPTIAERLAKNSALAAAAKLAARERIKRTRGVVLTLVGAAVFTAAAVVVDDWAIDLVALLADRVCWTLFVQDHMTWRNRKR